MKRPRPFDTTTSAARPAFGLEPSQAGAPPEPPKKAPARFTDTGPVRAGGRLGPYVVTAELARGGMGVVYRARHEGLGREVALKVLPLGALAGKDELARFRLEARAAARLRHPNVVVVHDVGESEGVVYLAMDLVAGRSLEALAAAGPLDPREAATLCAKVADGLHHAHAQGVLHRDLKPANVLVTPEGEPMLVDFGLAKVVDAGEELAGPTRSGQLLGTPSYMAPEQAKGVYADARTDVYGLGGTLYTALTGEVPFDGPDLLRVLYRVINQDVTAPSSLRPGLDRDLETICLACLEKEPARRYASAAELADDLRRWLRGEAIRARPPTRVERLGRWVRRNRVAAAAAAYAVGLVVVGGTVGTVWAVRRRAAEEVRAAET
ncbi:MAG: serine/threonine protein kinase, partial [Planctomycetes bacterium]|nr:serine/threonine protein kinase [Planctomycetota bacterium]